ncbi:unnamed protein product [Pleuronectes platessa]|uniref:Uncharacterized protein n=1 Tax=Pleuronectes platessa TaxID=8262 RepID=A0A9N7V8K2_PLEPL|nr:unnamed protein product [Pleuronectes platessa]
MVTPSEDPEDEEEGDGEHVKEGNKQQEVWRRWGGGRAERERVDSRRARRCTNKRQSRSVNVWRNTICHHPASPPSEEEEEEEEEEAMEGSVSLNATQAVTW